MGNVACLWNPRSNHRLRRYWIRFDDRIVITGESIEQAGILSLRPARRGGLQARLRVMGREYEEPVNPGNDIALWINGLELFVGVKAVDDDHLLVAFGIPPGSRVRVTLESGECFGGGTDAPPGTMHAPAGTDAACPVGICQSRP